MAYSGEKDSLLSLFQSKHPLSAASLFLFRFIKKPHYLFVSTLIGQHK